MIRARSWVIYIATCASLLLPVLGASADDVQLYEKTITVPTYEVGAADKNPIFYTGRVYQGAQGPVYPYPLLNRISSERTNKQYNAVYLENEYIKICVLPEIGGRLFTAQDKTNGYDFFYQQHVIKPALIGMLGAWISGGIEWNVPHHHRASGFMPVDYTLEEHADGSKTVWVGEIEPRHRMRWLVGLTLHPGRSYIELTGKVINRTPLAHSFLFWANAAVHANENYQVIFPPATEYGVYHNKNQFTEWPISHQNYMGHDFSAGVDVSWWKNIPSPMSFFCWDYQDDFFGGYDHGKNAGVVSIADHHTVPGKKDWVWGKNDYAAMWDKILSDSDGPYIELMTGAYSDNQPDYSWVQPYETKTCTIHWYPLRGIQGFKNANLNAAVNLEVSADKVVHLGFNTSTAYPGAKVVLSAAGKSLFETDLDIAPDKPFWKELPLPADVAEKDLKAVLADSTGTELVSYTPVKKTGAPMPDTAKPPLKPEEIKSVDELYFTGFWLEQFYNPSIEPYPYYEEALKRDPGDYRVNTQLATLYIKRGMFADAEKHLRAALERATKNYTTPKDGEAFYFLGVVLQYQGRLEEAYDAFSKSAWMCGWQAAAHLNLAEIDCLRGRLDAALNHVNQSLVTNNEDPKAFNLKATLLRRLGQRDEAMVAAKAASAIDPLDFWAANEIQLMQSRAGAVQSQTQWPESMTRLFHDYVQNYLELATDYGDCGFYEEAIEVLEQAANSKSDKLSQFPMVYYDLGYYEEQHGAMDRAIENYAKAAKMPSDYCFPYRLESIAVLNAAMKQRPNDAITYYYLGDLLYDRQRDEAVMMWEKAVSLDDSLSLAHRNLAFAYSKIDNDVPKALAHMEKALQFHQDDPRHLYELDVLREAAKVPPEQRLKLLEDNHAVVNQWDDALAREIGLCVLLGEYDRALKSLENRRFLVWEGGSSMHSVFVDAHQLRGERHLAAREYDLALADFQAALEYPENFGMGRPGDGDREPSTYYFIGLTYEGMGKADQATEAFRKCVGYEKEMNERAYHQALAHIKLGEKDAADKLLAELADSAQKSHDSAGATDVFAKFGEKESREKQLAQYAYLSGLSALGKGVKDEAKTHFEEALKLDMCHLGARTELERIGK